MPSSSNEGVVVFGVCVGCEGECVIPPFKVPVLKSLRWTNKSGRAQVDYEPYCMKVKCIDEAVRATRRYYKAHGINIAGVETDPAPPVAKTRKKKKRKKGKSRE
ncbi:MAG: hypothetical protein GTO63_34280 [Anaerolineae bacterium]|nr:hypothetical protein [Anaerolineae bacterium]NIN99708.1 hypothetical protein [Anaerolineae bacterium]NIQ82560.1 hypothetical protein [Anaerolineae bacterium]